MRILLFFSLVILGSCNTQKKNTETKSSFPNQPVYVYKTTNNYFNNVPITLSQDKSKIVSYPSKDDVKIGTAFTTPTKLVKGYLLDNRGINANTVFLSYKYKDYSQFMIMPKLEEMFRQVIDKDPFTELYYCGKRSDFADIENDLNKIIKKGNLDSFKRIK